MVGARTERNGNHTSFTLVLDTYDLWNGFDKSVDKRVVETYILDISFKITALYDITCSCNSLIPNIKHLFKPYLSCWVPRYSHFYADSLDFMDVFGEWLSTFNKMWPAAIWGSMSALSGDGSRSFSKIEGKHGARVSYLSSRPHSKMMRNCAMQPGLGFVSIHTSGAKPTLGQLIYVNGWTTPCFRDHVLFLASPHSSAL